MKSRDQVLLEEAYKKVLILEDFQSKIDNIRSIIQSASSYESAKQDLIKTYPKLDLEDPTRPPYEKPELRFAGCLYSFKHEFYKILSMSDEKKLSVTGEQLSNAVRSIKALGLNYLEEEIDWHYFTNPGNPKRTRKKKLHLRFEDPQHIVQFVSSLKENFDWIWDLKFSILGDFEGRRDNTVLYPSDEGLEHCDEIMAKAKQSKATHVSIGEDFAAIDRLGDKRKISATEIEAARLALQLALKSNYPYREDILKRKCCHDDAGIALFVVQDPYCQGLIRSKRPSLQPALDTSHTVILKGNNNTSELNITTTFGRDTLKELVGDDARFFSPKQFTITKKADGWFISHENESINPTNINGALLSGSVKLKLNDVISVGKQSQKGKIVVSQ